MSKKPVTEPVAREVREHSITPEQLEAYYADLAERPRAGLGIGTYQGTERVGSVTKLFFGQSGMQGRAMLEEDRHALSPDEFAIVEHHHRETHDDNEE